MYYTLHAAPTVLYIDKHIKESRHIPTAVGEWIEYGAECFRGESGIGEGETEKGDCISHIRAILVPLF